MSTQPLPAFYVGKSATEERINNYATHKLGLLTQAIGKPDTESIWYSKEHIEALLEEINIAGGDGVRMHLGMYENGHEFEKQLCLVMNVTREVMVGTVTTHPNVIIEDEPGFTERSSQSRDAGLGNNILSKKRDFNYGSPCPPRCEPPPPPPGGD